jgi:hypothetical protein
MKLLYVAFAGAEQRGVHRKLSEQLAAFRAAGVETEMVVFADGGRAPIPPGTPYHVIDLPGGGFGAPGRAAAFHTCWELARAVTPDVVYMRYPIFDSHVARFVREWPVVFETQTIIAREMPTLAPQEERWAREVLPHTAGLVAVTPEILAHDVARAGWAIPGHVMPNGADPSTIPLTVPQLAHGRIDVVCVAAFHPWHGIDRLVVGMAREREVTDLHLHLVGDGPFLPFLRQVAEQAGLADRIHFHGDVPVAQLDRFYAMAHVAIGSLAPHRVGLRELAALKHREYALRGLPMVLGGGDADFPASLPWLRQFPADDSPISPRTLRALATGWAAPARRQQVRQWAEGHLAWSVKIPRLVAFLDALRGGAGRRAPHLGAAVAA